MAWRSWKSGGAEASKAKAEWTEQDIVGDAVTQALAPVLELETEWDSDKLHKRMKMYFRNAAKGLEFTTKPWNELVEEYADKVFASIFQALKDRQWVLQADFVLVLDAGIRESFPPKLLKPVSQEIFERCVLQAHDRAFEEQRFSPLLWDTISEKVTDANARKKAYTAIEEGRKQAAARGPVDGTDMVEDFVSSWINSSITLLAADCADLEAMLPCETAVSLFNALLEGGALPLPLVKESGPPPSEWPIVTVTLQDAYTIAALTASERPASSKPASATASSSRGKRPAKTPGGANSRGTQAWATQATPAGYGNSWSSGVAKGKGGWAQKRPSTSLPNGGNAGAYSSPSAAKRPRPVAHNAVPSAIGGHPLCTQKEDCIGDAHCALLQHLESGQKGDIYCSACWAVFADSDESLEAVPYEA